MLTARRAHAHTKRILISGNNENLVQFQLCLERFNRIEMAVMDRIKRAAENAYLFKLFCARGRDPFSPRRRLFFARLFHQKPFLP